MAEKRVTQEAINSVWSSEWRAAGGTVARNFFTQRLFVEGYPVFKKYVPSDAKRILDIGSGSGRYGLRLAQDFPEAHVTIADILPESLELARRIAKELGVTNVSFEQQDINNLTYSNERFDVVFCDVVIQHLPSVHLAMQEMRRVLKFDGVVVVSTMNTWNIHTLTKYFARFVGGGYKYGYEKSYRPSELKKLFFSYHLDTVALDGFYPAYGIYRLKAHTPVAAFTARILNRLTKILDKVTGRFFSKQFGFEVFVVGKKWNTNVTHSNVSVSTSPEDEIGKLLSNSELVTQK